MVGKKSHHGGNLLPPP